MSCAWAALTAWLPTRKVSAASGFVVDAWHEARAEWDWADMGRYVTHQVSNAYTQPIIDAIDLDPAKVPIAFPHGANVGSASLPMTLAAEAQSRRWGTGPPPGASGPG